MTKPSRVPAERARRYAIRNTRTFSITVDEADIDALFNGLEEDIETAVRPAAQAGAQVLYEAVKANASRIGGSGHLARTIYQAFSVDNSGPGKATYHVSWNANAAPYAHLIEFGHIQRYVSYIGKTGQWAGQWVTDKDKKLKVPVQVAAQPFLRPAMSQFSKAAEAMQNELLNRVARRSE